MHGYFVGNKATQCVLDTGCFSKVKIMRLRFNLSEQYVTNVEKKHNLNRKHSNTCILPDTINTCIWFRTLKQHFYIKPTDNLYSYNKHLGFLTKKSTSCACINYNAKQTCSIPNKLTNLPLLNPLVILRKIITIWY